MTSTTRPDGSPDTTATASVFSAPVQHWLGQAFAAPTPVQQEAWQQIATGADTLLVAPTGSGKTLAAFLQAIDTLLREPSNEPATSVLYVSPMKALAADIERNLQAPLRGIQLATERLSDGSQRAEPLHLPTIGMRTGDTPAKERQAMLRRPPDILITTPESLFLMLSGQAREGLGRVRTIIIDEIHALVGTKRGAHLQLSIERLAEQVRHNDLPEPQRIGLSATVAEPEQVAHQLQPNRPVGIVRPPAHKLWDLSVQACVPDMQHLDEAPRLPYLEPDEPQEPSIWPHLEYQLYELVSAHRSTICFVNSRRTAERITSHLNELHQRLTSGERPEAAGPRTPAQVMAQSAVLADNGGTVIAQAHHGSVSKERRRQIEEDLKAGRLPCVIATSALELGIDMGGVDLVLQVGAAPSTASGLQRVGRAGHQVGAVSKGITTPTHRSDLVTAAVVAEQMLDGAIEPTSQLRNPLDVLAQQVLSMCLDRTDLTSARCFEVVRRCAAYQRLPRELFDAVLQMLAGRYPSEQFAELRPRLVWDLSDDTLQARPGAKRLVTTSGGTIPDRGLFGVFLAGEAATGAKRVGELDEEMVYESRVGDTFTLGTSTWRIEDITPHQVLVSPAPGQPSRLPFWHADAPSRPLGLGLAVGRFLGRDPADQQPEVLDPWAKDNLASYLQEQREATGELPSDRQIVVERTRDELGDWRLVVHCPLGLTVLAPWALAIEQRAEELGYPEVRAWAHDDGIVIRVPDADRVPDLDLLPTSREGITDIVTARVFGSALFAARFRECAARALLLPRLDPTRRTPLWQQRQRSSQLLSVALQHPDFPIVLETARECLEDVYDLDGLLDLLGRIESRKVGVRLVETPTASPFAKSLMFGAMAEFIYDADQPVAERSLAALGIDEALLAQLLGREPSDVLLDPAAAQEVEAELQRLAEGFRPTSAEAAWDMLRQLGPLTSEQLSQRGVDQSWLDELGRRVLQVRISGVDQWVVAEDAALVTTAHGLPLPAGAVSLEAPSPEEATARLVQRTLLHRTGRELEPLAELLGLPESGVQRALRTLSAQGSAQQLGSSWWSPEVLGRVRRRALANLRASVEPAPQHQLATFLHQWHGLGSGGPDSLLEAVELLAGYPIPASQWETSVLPARMPQYQSTWLDEALARGEVTWTGHGALGLTDGWVQLWPSDLVPTPAVPGDLSSQARDMLQVLGQGGAWTITELVARGAAMRDQPGAASENQSPADTAEPSDPQRALWELVWAGLVTADSALAWRELASTRKARRARALHRPRAQQRRLAVRPGTRTPSPGTSATLSGVRWRLVQGIDPDPTTPVSLVLNRHGVVTRQAVATEPIEQNFSQLYRVLTGWEDHGLVRRGYFVEGLGAAQFALPGAIDALRDAPSSESGGDIWVLSVVDPANPYGSVLAWPQVQGPGAPSVAGARPSRSAGALVVTEGGRLVLYLERGGHSMLTFSTDQASLERCITALSQQIGERRAPGVAIERINTEPALSNALGPVLEAAGFRITPKGYRRGADSRPAHRP